MCRKRPRVVILFESARYAQALRSKGYDPNTTRLLYLDVWNIEYAHKLYCTNFVGYERYDDICWKLLGESVDIPLLDWEPISESDSESVQAGYAPPEENGAVPTRLSGEAESATGVHIS